MLWNYDNNAELSELFATEPPTESLHSLLYLNSEATHFMLATELQA